MAAQIPIKDNAEWGIYAPSGDVSALTHEIAQLCHDPNRRIYLGQKLRQRALTHYSWHQAGQRIETIYKNLTRQIEADIMHVRIR